MCRGFPWEDESEDENSTVLEQRSDQIKSDQIRLPRFLKLTMKCLVCVDTTV